MRSLSDTASCTAIPTWILPNLLEQTYRSKKQPNLFFAGQMTGVEGYVESAASGLVAGINAARLFKGEEAAIFPETTAIGSLAHYITHADSKHFQPMNVNFGIIKELEGPRIRDKRNVMRKLPNVLYKIWLSLWKNNQRKEKVWRKSRLFLLKMV